MGTKIETDMRTAMFDHLQKLSFNYFDNTKVAQIMTCLLYTSFRGRPWSGWGR